MKIMIDINGVKTIREFANAMPVAINSIADDTQRLNDFYQSISDQIGVHEEQFAEMMQIVTSAQKEASDAIQALVQQLKTTADQMETFINKSREIPQKTISSKNDSSFENIEGINQLEKFLSLLKRKAVSPHSTSLSPEIMSYYQDGIIQRLNKLGTNKTVRELYYEYERSIQIFDYNFTGVAFYSAWGQGIKLNAIKDAQNEEGQFSDYFHEVGHFLDDIAGNGHACLSSDPLFRSALETDADNFIRQTMLINKCDLMEAYEIISDELQGNICGGASDIFGSLTHCRVQGDWGHHPDYWSENETRIEKEAFANMFEASIGDSAKKEAMIKFFPNAYAYFESIIRSRNK